MSLVGIALSQKKMEKNIKMEVRKEKCLEPGRERRSKYWIIIMLLAAVLVFRSETVLLAGYYDEYILPDSNSRTYTADSLSRWMSSEDARIAKNEIYN